MEIKTVNKQSYTEKKINRLKVKSKIYIFVSLIIIHILKNLYHNKFTLVIISENVSSLIIGIVFITILWLIFVFLPRKNLHIVVKINRWIAKNIPVVLRLRYLLIDIPAIIRWICMFNLVIDKTLRKLLFLNKRVLTIGDLIRRLIHWNIMYWILLPVKLCYQFYLNILKFIFHTTNINITDYIRMRIKFLILSIICYLLLGVTFFKIIILTWILETIFMTYASMYYYFFEFLEQNNEFVNERLEENVDTWMNYMGCVIAWKLAQNKLEQTYDHTIAHTMTWGTSYRISTILLYVGISLQELKTILGERTQLSKKIELKIGILTKIRLLPIKVFNNYSEQYFAILVADVYYTTLHPYDFLLMYISHLVDSIKKKPKRVENLMLNNLSVHLESTKENRKIKELLTTKLQAFIDDPKLWLEFKKLDKKYRFMLWQAFWFDNQPDFLNFWKKLEKYGKSYFVIDEKEENWYDKIKLKDDN